MGSPCGACAAPSRTAQSRQVLIGARSLVLHALVLATGSRLPAMVVHAIANLIAAIRGDKRFRELDAAQEAA